MIVDKTDGYLDEVKAFAEKAGKADQLKERLDYLADYGQQGTTRCLLFKDFAPMSFQFEMQVKTYGEWARWFNGGLIFHGNHDGHGSGAAPTLSVCLNPTDGWAVHT